MSSDRIRQYATAVDDAGFEHPAEAPVVDAMIRFEERYGGLFYSPRGGNRRLEPGHTRLTVPPRGRAGSPDSARRQGIPAGLAVRAAASILLMRGEADRIGRDRGHDFRMVA
ncbi:hypothetical protein ACH4E7_24680 [Kitasatospora sp. NPDC018058]|uniref:hypothetical protein n=1 Tax=Kitasatospora sp. NPDC018058 TaxID=3364025 RepID=UPI0037C19BB0